MKKLSFVVIATMASFGFNSLASASESPFYIGFVTGEKFSNITPTEQEVYSLLSSETQHEEDGRRMTNTLFVGYDISPRIALEISYTKDPGAHSTTTRVFDDGVYNGETYNLTVTRSQKITEDTGTISAVGKYPMNQSVQAIGRLGFAKNHSSREERSSYRNTVQDFDSDYDQVKTVSSTDTTIVFGVGMDVSLTDNTDLRIEWARNGGENHSTVGATFHF